MNPFRSIKNMTNREMQVSQDVLDFLYVSLYNGHIAMQTKGMSNAKMRKKILDKLKNISDEDKTNKVSERKVHEGVSVSFTTDEYKFMEDYIDRVDWPTTQLDKFVGAFEIFQNADKKEV